MKNLLLIIPVILFCNIVLAQNSGEKKYKAIPTVEIKDVKGNPFNTSQIENDGKPIIISFWATWCKPCIKELTTELKERLKECGELIIDGRLVVDEARPVAAAAVRAQKPKQEQEKEGE